MPLDAPRPTNPTRDPRAGFGSPCARALPSAPPDILEARELSHVRSFAWLGLGLPVALVLFLPFLRGDASFRITFGASLLSAAAASAALLWSRSLRNDEACEPWQLVLAGALYLVAALAGLRFFGEFSAVVVVLPLLVIFLGMTRDTRVQSLGYIAPAASYFVLALAALRRAGATPGLVTSGALSPVHAMVVVAVVEVVLVITFVALRAELASTLLIAARSERAAWAIVQKDAQVAELQKDLARALDVVGVGRFSDTVIGSYRLSVVVGRGAMGEVYEATHVENHTTVAVKILHAHTLVDPSTVARFEREARMAMAIDSKHAIKVHEIGGLDGALPYLVMEMLRGEDLADLLHRTTRLPFPDILRLVAEIGVGLSAARKAGIVHQDVKPRNLFLAEEPGSGDTTWKLIDFGIARFASADPHPAGPRVTGTPEYMAPEQASGEGVSHRTDLFSLAAVVYRALTGYQAFSGDHIVEVLYEIGHAMPPRPSDLCDLRPEVDLVLAVALAKSPADRFDSAEEFAGALASAAQGSISPEIRDRAARVLAAFPWGDRPSFEG